MATVFSCVLDHNEVMAYQFLIWFHTITSLAGVPKEDLVVHVIDRPAERRLARDPADLLSELGVEYVIVPPFDPRHNHSNKLRQLHTPQLQAAEEVVLCDCDLAFAGPVREAIRGDQVRAKIVDHVALTDYWPRIYADAGWPNRPLTALTTVTREPTSAANCDGGFYVLPRPAFEALGKAWPKWAHWLLDHPHLLGDSFKVYTDQVSFALAMDELGLSIDPLTSEFNCETQGRLDVLNVPPNVLHFHSHFDQDGCLLKSGDPMIDASIARVNVVIREMGLKPK